MKKKDVQRLKNYAAFGLSIAVIGVFVVIAILQEKEIIEIV